MLDALLQQKLTLLKREYPRALNRDLAKHQSQYLFSRNVIGLQKKLLSELETELSTLECASEDLKSKLLNQAEAFVQSALTHNRSSCAISNFPDEHHPSTQYIGDVLAQCETLFDEFLIKREETTHYG